MTITDTLEIISTPRCSPEQARLYLTSRHRAEMIALGLYADGKYKSRKAKENGKTINADYNPNDIAAIVGHYAPLCEAVGIPIELPIAQLIKEATSLTSFWSRRPQRNPSGIGVNGHTSSAAWDDHPLAHTAWKDSKEADLWRWNGIRNQWEYGLSFPSWDVSARQHIGRLLCWALRTGQGSEVQKELIAEANTARVFPIQCRGMATILKRLGRVHNPTGIGWASPGETYGKGIAEIVNAMVAYKEG